MSTSDLSRFGEIVVGDVDLRRELLSTTEYDAFVGLVVRRARERGFQVTAIEVEEGLRARRSAWRRRWI